MRKSNISILVTWSTQRRNFSSLRWMMWWLNCVCVGRVLLSKLKLYKQLDIPDGGHIRGCLVWRVTRKCDSRFWGRMWPNLWSLVSPVCPPLHPPSDRAVMSWTSTCCFSISDMWAPRCVTPGCDGRVWRKVWPNLWSLFSPSLVPAQPTHHTAPAQLDAVCATDSRARNET